MTTIDSILRTRLALGKANKDRDEKKHNPWWHHRLLNHTNPEAHLVLDFQLHKLINSITYADLIWIFCWSHPKWYWYCVRWFSQVFYLHFKDKKVEVLRSYVTQEHTTKKWWNQVSCLLTPSPVHCHMPSPRCDPRKPLFQIYDCH